MTRSQNSKVTTYYDSHNENMSLREFIALREAGAKPYPKAYYTSEGRTLGDRNLNLIREIKETWQVIEEDTSYDYALEIDWSEFSCPLNRWEMLYCQVY